MPGNEVVLEDMPGNALLVPGKGELFAGVSNWEAGVSPEAA